MSLKNRKIPRISSSMSLLPPTPFVMSKLKYLIIKKLPPDEYKELIEKLGPFFIFRVHLEVRDVQSGSCYEFQDIEKVINHPNHFDCIDTCLNFTVTVKKAIIDKITAENIPTVIRLGIQCIQDVPSSIDATQQKWTDLWIDDFPVCIPGLQTYNTLSEEEKKEYSKGVDESKM